MSSRAAGAGRPLLEGDDVFDGTAGINLPVAGFVEAMRQTTHQLVPTAWGPAASPSAHVTRGCLRAHHRHDRRGAALPARHPGRRVPGSSRRDGRRTCRRRRKASCWRACARSSERHIPVVASLDLHANVTQRMLEHADVLIAYRTYPHVDMAETGARVARYLQQRAGGAAAPAPGARRPVPFLIPLQTQCTMLEPTKTLYEELARLEDRTVTITVLHARLPGRGLPGVPARRSSAYARGSGSGARAADLLRGACGRGAGGGVRRPVYAPEEAVRRAIALSARRPPGGDRRHPGQSRRRRRIRHDRHAACAGRRERAARGARPDGRSARPRRPHTRRDRAARSRSRWANGQNPRVTRPSTAASSSSGSPTAR